MLYRLQLDGLSIAGSLNTTWPKATKHHRHLHFTNWYDSSLEDVWVDLSGNELRTRTLAGGSPNSRLLG